MIKTFEFELPESYREALVIDAKNKKFGVVLNVVAFLVMVAFALGSFFIIRPDYYGNVGLLRICIFCVVMLAYIILHELVHGIFYKVMTKQKLTFGLTLTVAYCGVPNIYVYRRTALLSLLAPLVVFTAVFTILVIFIPDAWGRFFAWIMMGIHLGGCSGDIYGACLFFFKFKSKDVLMNDTGPKQSFYVKD